MNEAYRVEKFHHVTPEKRLRLLEEGLVPILDKFPNVHILENSADDIMFHEDGLRMDISTYDTYENQILTIQAMLQGDWLVEYYDRSSQLYLHKVDGYRYDTRTHLYIKHFVHIAYSFPVSPKALSTRAHEILESTTHLDTLPLSFVKMLDTYEKTVREREAERARHELDASITEAKALDNKRREGLGLQNEAHIYHKMTPQLLVMVRNKILKEQGYASSKSASRDVKQKLHDRIKSSFTKGMTYAELVVATKTSSNNPHGLPGTQNPNKVVDKQAWAIFQQLYPGRLPEKGQIASIRNEIIRNQQQTPKDL